MLKTRDLQNEDESTGASLKAILLIPIIGIAASLFVAFEVPGSNVAPDGRVTTMAEVYLAADGPPPSSSLAKPAIETPDIAVTCAGSMDANGDECDNGLEPTPTLATATKPSLDKSAGPALAKVGAAIGKPLNTAQSTAKQPDPENHIVGCARGCERISSTTAPSGRTTAPTRRSNNSSTRPH